MDIGDIDLIETTKGRETSKNGLTSRIYKEN